MPSAPADVYWRSVAAEPSPQVTCSFQGLSGPGSPKEPRPKLFDVPSSPVSSACGVRLGFTLFTTTVVSYVVEPPSLSKIRPLTTWLEGPSANVQVAEALAPAAAYEAGSEAGLPSQA